MNSRDPERGRVVTTIIETGTEEWVEFVSERAASEGVDHICSTNIIKGDNTLIIVHKHPHLLRLRFQREDDIRVGKSYILITIPQL
ncbi:mitochondrial import receptor subunit TOM20 homolog [Lates japonicus]|uniref:Mitochondrial import receptor subunit TOM20 homolog n=1 Tax=Lates japonicus TaxID=270547 RepID=A0AAD3R4K8_LATJO|nr:mitochondrial import receptor subunit TOM20 homolog [Lates japonicus]